MSGLNDYLRTLICFDKTGTITHGNWTLQKIAAFAPCDENRALKLAAGLEQNSDHFIGREILRQAQKRNIEPATLDDIRTEENGVTGRFGGDIATPHLHLYRRKSCLFDEVRSRNQILRVAAKQSC